MWGCCCLHRVTGWDGASLPAVLTPQVDATAYRHEGAGKLHWRIGMPSAHCSRSQTDYFKWCFTLHCKSNLPLFFFFFPFFLSFFFSLLATHLPTNPTETWCWGADEAANVFSPMISTWAGLCAGERHELIAESSQEQSFGERINLISTFKEKGGLSLYQFMLQHISVVNLFVEGLIKKTVFTFPPKNPERKFKF